MGLDASVIAPRIGLTRPVPVAALREAVAGQRSWRGVLRVLGFTTSRTGRVLKDICDELGIDYSHFNRSKVEMHPVEEVVRSSTTWPEVMDRLGFARGSGTARATIRRHCQRLGIDVSGLSIEPGAADVEPLIPRRDQLRHAGPYLVAAALTLAGVAVGFAPEGAAYDLLADFAGLGVKRIQVKTTTSVIWQCGISRKEYSGTGHGGHRRALYSAEDVDYFGCVTFEQAIFLIPIAVVEGRSSISLRRFEAFRLPGHAAVAPLA
jgi:hypothetical protein